jgi:phosphoribosylanthranilate isomerase
MIVQIYEVSSPVEASLCGFGVDHIGVLVGDGSFPRERSIELAKEIFSAIAASSKSSALSLSADLKLIRKILLELNPAILHLGASTELLLPFDVTTLKKEFLFVKIMRSIPVIGDESVTLAKSYDGVADILLLDSHKPGDKQIGALGITHNWELDRQIVESVSIPVIMAGGLGPENVVDAIKAVHPAGVDTKTKIDKKDGSHTKDLEEVRKFTEAAKGWRPVVRFIHAEAEKFYALVPAANTMCRIKNYQVRADCQRTLMRHGRGDTSSAVR